jgi:hypothetical protein
VRTSFALFEEKNADLERAEREAGNAVRAAVELERTLAADRNRRLREQDKMSGLVVQVERAARRIAELHSEAEQEERVRATQQRPC